MLIHLLLFSGLCLFTHGTRNYMLVPVEKTWADAQAYCKLNCIDLATVQTTEDVTNIAALIFQSASFLVWTGLYLDVNSWRWSYNNEGITYSNFFSGEPNNNGGQECVASYYGDWNDLSCSFKFEFFCYDATQTGAARYVLVSDVLRTWQDAQIYCRLHYTDMAIIRTQADNDVISVPTVNGDYAWIGMFRDTWKWSDGTKVDAYPINWASTDPDLDGIDLIGVAADPDGYLNDQYGSDFLPFICMCDPTTTTTTTPITTVTVSNSAPVNISKLQILRVEITSGQYLNSTNMQLIFQWIKHKLTVQGVNITNMTWRVQPDGNVFTPKDVRAEETNPQQIDCSAQRFNK
ncbi:macrophage mannose receptor 1-like [Misgurnus anguillicaudatus]|uniref:macrophage mannose receptor 1-like n=1 Tax=Misgurnus anguillicaudatus TaxID=75329 RepID=UPI003CCF04CB